MRLKFNCSYCGKEGIRNEGELNKWENNYCNRICMSLNRTKSTIQYPKNCHTCGEVMKRTDRILLSSYRPSLQCKKCREEQAVRDKEIKLERQEKFRQKFKRIMND